MRIHTGLTRAEIIDAMQEAQRAHGIMNHRVDTDRTGRFVYEYRARTARPRLRIADPGFGAFSEHASRTHARAFEIQLSGDSSRGPNSGQFGAGDDRKAATWDQWGTFLSALFEVDPAARVGGAKSPIYIDRDHFHWSTGGRYLGTPDDNGVRRVDAPTGTFLTAGKGYHRQHKWTSGGSSVTGAYYVSECACGAIVRRVAYGRSWSEISA